MPLLANAEIRLMNERTQPFWGHAKILFGGHDRQGVVRGGRQGRARLSL